jgi:uncharacterized protein
MENQADKNAEIVRRGYKAFNEADINTLAELFDDNCSWHTPGKSPLAGDHIGKEAVFTQFGHFGNDTLGTFKADLKHVLTCEHDRVVGVHHNTAERNGKKLDTWCCIYFKLKDGKVLSGREHFYDQYAWDEFWA